MDDVAKNGGTLHLLGLVSPGGVHSMQRHGENLSAIAAIHGVKRIRFHCFMDGRDVDPHSGAGYIETLKQNLEALSAYAEVDARIATVSGRYWAMDRDNRWERVERAYDVITLPSDTETDPVEGVRAYYEKDERGDEFIEPFACPTTRGVRDGGRHGVLQLPSRSRPRDGRAPSPRPTSTVSSARSRRSSRTS